MAETRTPTKDQLRACKNGRLDPSTGAWQGSTLVLEHWGGGDQKMYALVNEHGSVTYCPEAMLAAHLRGVPE